MGRGEETSNSERLKYLQRSIDAVAGAFQPDIHNHDGGALLVRESQRFVSRGRDANHVETRLLQAFFRLRGDEKFVFDDQDASAAFALFVICHSERPARVVARLTQINLYRAARTGSPLHLELTPDLTDEADHQAEAGCPFANRTKIKTWPVILDIQQDIILSFL